MIEIAVGILGDSKSDKNKALRDWAVDALAHYAEEASVPLSEDAKGALREKPLPLPVTTIFDATTGRSYVGRSYFRGGGAVGEAGEIFEVSTPSNESKER